MANSEQFKDMTMTIKVGKKRTHNESLMTDPIKLQQDGTEIGNGTATSEDLKRPKLEEHTHTTNGHQ